MLFLRGPISSSNRLAFLLRFIGPYGAWCGKMLALTLFADIATDNAHPGARVYFHHFVWRTFIFAGKCGRGDVVEVIDRGEYGVGWDLLRDDCAGSCVRMVGDGFWGVGWTR